MISCPKCNFEQPADRFCANCGVDMDSYKAKTFPISINWKAFMFLLIGLGLIITGIVLKDKFKNLDPGNIYPESEITDSQTSAKFGTSSGLQLEKAAPEIDSVEAPQELSAIQKPIATITPRGQVEIKPINMNITWAEITNVEINQLLILKDNASEPGELFGGLADSIPMSRRLYTEQNFQLKSGVNTINYDDEYIKYEIQFELLGQDETKLKAKIRFSRVLDGGLQIYDNDAHTDFDIEIPYGREFYIVDRLPRIIELKAQLTASNTLLGSFHKSSNFMNDLSESILIFQFDNPNQTK